MGEAARQLTSREVPRRTDAPDRSLIHLLRFRAIARRIPSPSVVTLRGSEPCRESAVRHAISPATMRCSMSAHSTAVSDSVPSPPAELQQLLPGYRGPTYRGADIDEAALQRAVCSYVQQLKAAELPPERVLVTVKAIAHRGGVPLSHTEQTPQRAPLEGLMAIIVRWCIAEYYRTGEPRPSTSPS